MKEYLKMSGYFIGSVTINADGQICDDKHFRGSTDIAEDYYAPICHAINSHDELVAEVERLRGALQDAYLDGCYAGWGMSGQGYNAEHGGPKDWALHDMLATKSLEYMK